MSQSNSLQAKFIRYCMDKDESCSMYLASGIKLTGKIILQDEESLVLANEGSPTQLVFKRAISTVVPPKIDLDSLREYLEAHGIS